jgi:Zn-dependent metalloprotease
VCEPNTETTNVVHSNSGVLNKWYYLMVDKLFQGSGKICRTDPVLDKVVVEDGKTDAGKI